ncbi:hypothetical protein [Umezawaea tangerina]|uniref:hypothetical protein n=1 Tax=Umezawaea tangerina TaxID=84725 RepID=UPI003183F4D7
MSGDGKPGPWVLPMLLVEALVLAVLELFYLPLRFDGTLLPQVGADWPFPIAVVVAVLTTPLLVLWASDLQRGLLVSSSPLLVWLTALVVLGLFGPGGDVMLPNDWRSLALLAGGALPGAIAVGASMGRNYVPKGTR